jgi:hypothetical protein
LGGEIQGDRSTGVQELQNFRTTLVTTLLGTVGMNPLLVIDGKTENRKQNTENRMPGARRILNDDCIGLSVGTIRV